ncbi:MAG: membrane-bound PQQ-dependent dehydrogenase, glucose/quinate/shikimate family, partial [Devosia sp.]
MDHTDRRGIGYWLTMLLGVVVGLTGLILGAGGLWLATLGGSWYYLITGLALIVTAWLIFRRERSAIYLYLAIFAVTVVWSVLEARGNGWAYVPRLGAPIILLILMLLASRVLRAHPLGVSNRVRSGATATAAFTLIGGLALSVGLHHDPAAAQQATAPVVPAVPAPAATAAAADLQVGQDWPVYGGTDHALRYSPLNEITPENVGSLKEVWTYRTGDLPKSDKMKDKYSPETTAIKVGDTLYLCSAMNIVLAVDAGSGKEKWRYDPHVSEGNVPYGATCRGVAYYAQPNANPEQACATRIIEATMDAKLLAVDAENGQPCADFGRDGAVNLLDGIGRTVPGWYGVNAPPMIVRNVVVTGAQVQDGQDEDAPSGVIRGYDAVSGKFLWAWDMGRPGNTAEPAPGETYTRGTPNMWTAAAGDDELGYVYLPLGNSSVDYFGGNRKDYENKFSSSLVAVDVTTGQPVWHFQTVHYDIWDYDLGSQPTLFDYPGDNGPIPALMLPSKQGELYVLNRRTGEPLTPVEEHKVPTGGVEPDHLSPTQPFSTYANVVSPNLTEADMWGMTPFDQLWCRIQFHQASYQGRYTPPTADKPFIEYPSYNGGMDWGSVAIDEQNGILITNYNDTPNYDQLIPRAEADKRGWHAIDDLGGIDTGNDEASPQKGAPYAALINAGWKVPWTGLLCKQPPYGGIRAIDLKTGKTLWDHPLGDARGNGPWGLKSHLPIQIGTPNNGGPLITAGGLVFIGATTDDMFRAFDIKTGKEVWSVKLPAGGQANPMT